MEPGVPIAHRCPLRDIRAGLRMSWMRYSMLSGVNDLASSITTRSISHPRSLSIFSLVSAPASTPRPPSSHVHESWVSLVRGLRPNLAQSVLSVNQNDFFTESWVRPKIRTFAPGRVSWRYVAAAAPAYDLPPRRGVRSDLYGCGSRSSAC